MEIIFTERFLRRVEEYSDYIALDDIPTAINWTEGVLDKCERLREHPESGRIVPEFNRSEIREIIHGNYRLVYEIKTDRIDILTIWHTSQMPPRESE